MPSNCKFSDCVGRAICPHIRFGGVSFFPVGCAMAPTSNSKKTNTYLAKVEDVKNYGEAEYCVVTLEGI